MWTGLQNAVPSPRVDLVVGLWKGWNKWYDDLGYEEQGGDHYLFPFNATTKPLSLALW